MKKRSIGILLILFLAPFTQVFESESVLANTKSQLRTSAQYSLDLVTHHDNIVNISGGGDYHCGLLDNGSVMCWGRNQDGRLGSGLQANGYPAGHQYVPTLTSALPGNRSAIAISAGPENTACALLNNGSVSCWGSGSNGYLGNGDTNNSLVPVLVDSFGSGRTAVALSTGQQHSCVILDNGSVSCWGKNSYGQLGNGGTSDSYSPTLTSAIHPSDSNRTAVELATGLWFSCALLDNGEVTCWGTPRGVGTLGNGANQVKYIPTLTNDFGTNRTAVSISAHYNHVCVVLDNGSVSCWGDGGDGALGNGGTSDQTSPTLTSSFGANRSAVAISTGQFHTCAILDDGTVSCWGMNSYGQLGCTGVTCGVAFSPELTPVQTASLGTNRTAISISSGNKHTCVILDNGQGSCWGDGYQGQLGNGIYALARNPVPRYQIAESAIEGQPINFPMTGTIFEGINLTQSNITIETPTGVTFDPFNLTLNGTPNYSSQLEWRMNISHGNEFRTANYTLEILLDTDLDGIPNIDDDDDDGDGFLDTADACPTVAGNSYIDLYGCLDNDSDGYSNLGDEFPFHASQYFDSDYDGFGDNISGFRGDDCPQQFGKSEWDRFGCVDADRDGYSDAGDHFNQESSQWNDTDGDGFGDEYNGFQGDNCPLVNGTSTQDRFGCIDSDSDGYSDDGDDLSQNPTQWLDRDGDGYGDNQSENATMSDDFPADGTQWNDTDGDGHGDNPFGTQGDWFPDDPLRWQDSDQDGVADEDDSFPYDGTQTIDSDGDGFGDESNGSNPDAFPGDPSEWLDNDGDGVGNNADDFPADGTQWNDTDGDGHGDNPFGTQGDWFPDDPLRWQDSDQDGVADEDDAFPNEVGQAIDSDGDGYGDDANGSNPDAFPGDPSEWLDNDGDGVGNNADVFPFDSSQQVDSDGDGYGDDANGSNPDAFPDDPTEWADTDGDDVGNNADAFPFDPSQQTDSDGDGFGDNDRGSGADKFPNDSTQWSDIDGDGYGDNQDGTNPDAFIADPTQWADADEDGYGDNPTGRQADAFVNDPTQWLDQDGDGLGDNLSGNNPDPYLFDFDNDGYNDSIDPLPKLASPGDLDNDGTPDVDDLFPEDFREWADADGDGEGDNADTDDDNDGWADTDELREGTDPFSSSSQPVNSFEIVLPGTTIGLGAWDLIGMFGGIPLFCWIGFGFVTRNGRTAKFETRLREANTRDELEGVARQWEYSLMLRLLGPHQGIRLERLRAELDDRYEAQNQRLSSIEPEPHDQTEMVEEAMNVDEKLIPAIQPDKPAANLSGVSDGKGYEWITQDDGMAWFRIENSDSEWELFEA